ncbi:hypothetical protein FPSM_02079 [Flavobacterium psychrophilum]|nr:hypothetical protein FPSM_02079 [Flavobacterium psychrophilum]
MVKKIIHLIFLNKNKNGLGFPSHFCFRFHFK